MTLERAERILKEKGKVKVVVFNNSDYIESHEIITSDWNTIIELYENSFDCVFTED